MKMKKMFALVATVAMVGVMGVTVFAAEGRAENRCEARAEQRAKLRNERRGIFEGVEREGRRATNPEERIVSRGWRSHSQRNNYN